MNRLELKNKRRVSRKKRVRKNISGTMDIPRVSVFKSNKNLSLQAINDLEGKTLVSVSSLEKDLRIKAVNKETGSSIGKVFGERLKAAKIETIVFDRNGFYYHGVIKAVADGIREAGIKF